MGLVVILTEVFTFSYQEYVGNVLIENEFDHVFCGVSNQNPNPDPAEVSDWNWVNIEELKEELIINPKYTALGFDNASVRWSSLNCMS